MQTQTLCIPFIHNMQKTHSYSWYYEISQYTCLNSHSIITTAVQSLVPQSQNIIQCWFVLWCFTYLVCSCSIFQRVFPTAYCFTSTYMKTSHHRSYHMPRSKLLLLEGIFTLSLSNKRFFKADTELLNIFTVPNAIIKIHSSKHLCSSEELLCTYHALCVENIRHLCRMNVQLVSADDVEDWPSYEYSLDHYKNTCNNPSVTSITWRVKQISQESYSVILCP